MNVLGLRKFKILNISLILSGLCEMASHVVIRQAVGFIYPAYKSLQAVMTEDNQVIVIVITIIITIIIITTIIITTIITTIIGTIKIIILPSPCRLL